ncbi:MAG: fimbrillin family protein [Tannerellaceae bacterium]|jgi:hypothetical protein|nr:fimbrillin family protein [Tannerellaceae bacterium]
MNHFIHNQASRLNTAILTIACLLAQTSCGDEVAVETLQARPLQIHVTAAGFASGKPETRASDTDYTTTFAEGDQIGITVIENGNVMLYDNVPYRYHGAVWAPLSADNKVYPYSGDGTITCCLVHYPYSAAMNNLMTKDAILAAFTPQTDQSDYSNYTKSDLMIAEGTISDGTLHVAFAHALALIEINLPEGSKNPTLRINGNDATLTPWWFAENSYRCIVKPATEATLDGGYIQGISGMVWQLSEINFEPGKYQTLTITNAQE